MYKNEVRILYFKITYKIIFITDAVKLEKEIFDVHAPLSYVHGRCCDAGVLNGLPGLNISRVEAVYEHFSFC
jgi:hypothetical protein